MTNRIRLDNIEHADLRVASHYGAEFGDAVNQVGLFVTEFDEAQRDYPILFLRQEDGMLQPVAILGLDRDENLYLEGGRWTAVYVPALARKGPFLIGFANGEPVIHVDLDHPRVTLADASGGDPLFLPHGGHAPALERAMDALRVLHAGREAAPAMTALFGDLMLVEPVAFKVQLSDTQLYKFEDYLAITPARIAALDGAALVRLNEAGLLAPAIFAAHSLANVQRLIARKRQRLD